ncbi:hypothetical protein CHISP_2552 [Chitinispirillum alkaliphilum]|nr:hypothetical protein CHISP_2552 [Chitinispirillum alkaliphilum]
MKTKSFFPLIVGALLVQSCSHRLHLTSFNEAQLHITNGQYREAEMMLNAIIDSIPESPVAADALYSLAMIHLANSNPDADFYKAMDRFETFTAAYPEDPRQRSAQNWLHILGLYTQTKEKLYTALETAHQFQTTYEENLSKQLNLETLNEDIRRCYEERENLLSKTEEFRSIIIELERKCLQAGR